MGETKAGFWRETWFAPKFIIQGRPRKFSPSDLSVPAKKNCYDQGTFVGGLVAGPRFESIEKHA